MAKAFTSFSSAARALLKIECLSEKEGQFCGGLAYRTAPLSDKQKNWLRILLARHGLLPLVDPADALYRERLDREAAVSPVSHTGHDDLFNG